MSTTNGTAVRQRMERGKDRKRRLSVPLLSVALPLVLCGFGSQAGAQATITLAITSGGSVVTTVPFGSTVTLTATVGSGAIPVGSTQQVSFCESAAVSCTGSYLLGTASVSSASPTGTFSFVPGPGQHSFYAILASAPGSPSAVSGLVVSLTSMGKEQPTSTLLAPSGGAGNYTLTGTVTGYVTTAGSSSAPTGTVSFTDTANGGNVAATASLGGAVATQGWTALAAPPAVGLEPQGIVTADFNADGISDIATTNLFGPSVSILLGSGDGSFKLVQTIPTGTGSFPPALATGDFGGGHGNTDLAVSNGLATSPGVSFYTNDGSGNFTLLQNVSLPGTPSGVVTGPNNTYVAAASGTDTGTVSILTRSGTTWSVTQNIPVDPFPDFIAVTPSGLAVTHFPDSGTGSLTFLGGSPFAVVGSSTEVNGPIGIAVTSDGDLVVANNGGNTVSVFLPGATAGGYGSPTSYQVGQGPYGVITGDFNEDGHLDIAVANKTDNTVSILLGNGGGSFQPQFTLQAGSAPALPAVGNFEGHGNTDLAVTNSGDSTVSILFSNVTRTTTATAADVALAGSGTHQVTAIYPGDSNFNPSASPTVNLLAQPMSTALTLTATPSNVASVSQQVALSATLAPYNSGNLTTNGDAVTFYDGTATLGTGTLTSGVATLNTTSLSMGSNTLTAKFSGDSNFSPSMSPAIMVTVGSSAPELSLSPTSLTFSAQTVDASSAAQTILLTNTGTTALNLSSIAASGDFAETNTCGTSVATGASCSIVVTFTPTAGGARSGMLTVTDNATDSPQTVALSGTGTTFSVSPTSSTLTIASPGGSATATLQLASVSGFSGTTNLTCAVSYQGQGTPKDPPTCSLNPTQVQISGNSSASSTLTVSTTGTSKPASSAKILRDSGFAFAALLLAGFLPRRRWRGGLLLALIGTVAFGGLLGCDGSSGGGGSANQTTPGNYQVAVTATSGSYSVTTNLQLTVQ